MAKKMLIDATHAEETRVVVVDGNKVEEFDFESENKRQLAGNIYLAKVTRVEPSLQAAFIDYGGNRHGFLAFSEIHPDYYQIPVADREALMEEERAYAEAMKAREEEDEKPKRRPRRRSSAKAAKVEGGAEDAVLEGEISGMETIDLETEDGIEGLSPMETVNETPVEEPQDGAEDTSADAVDADDADTDDGDDDAEDTVRDAAAHDDEIESVADEDDQEDIRPVRKPRPRRYKIQEVVKVRQIMLVQVVKEERGNKGAALTTYLSLAGRYCVLMPNTARGGGISRKITNAADRKKLKETASEIDLPQGAGLIVRTAGAKRTKTEIKRDYEYLQRTWEQIRELTLKSIAPAKIYEEGDLIKRSIRDLYSRDIDEVLVEGERGYRNAKDFMKMIMPSHAKNVKHYGEQMPLFARYQVESYLGGMFNPTVQLKSGGYIVIGVTEALVAIDVNSGRATKEGSIEETATKTNLEAAEEVARQLRLRDLAGLIVIDFIDMDERKNNLAVEKRLKDKLKTDRARIQVGRISGFGLLEMSRQRLRPGMLEATTQPCHACHGTGLIRSDDSMALNILRQIEEEGTRRRSREVLVKCPVDIANYLMNQKREHVAAVEARYGLSVRIEGDPHLVSPDFTLEKFKTATRVIPEPVAFVSASASLMDEVDDDIVDEVEEETAEAPEAEEEDQKPKKRRRRRRRRRGSGNGENGDNGSGDDQSDADDADGDTPAEVTEDAKSEDTPAEAEAEAPEAEEKPKKRTRSRSRKKKVEDTPAEPAAEAAVETPATPEPAADATPEPDVTPEPEAPAEPVAEAAPEPEAPAEPEPAAQAEPEPEPAAEPEQAEAPAADPAPEPEKELEPAEAAEDSDKPKRRGWWSLGKG
ncbi:Rne/Rng family ribonuclease [Pseudooceanicola onchidii]|uniref:Rne/Rng family ribonuclease n=1 Tax=Pseudooceanicola onchidii TaxID=2562279 RepID=UPI00197FE674|nr:ribonuclease E/G [Pseudooceanicola onchidii]